MLCPTDITADSNTLSRPSFFVTWETITPESAVHGDVADYGFIHPEHGKTSLAGGNRLNWQKDSGFTLREAIQAIWDNAPCSASTQAIEPNCSDIEAADSISVYFGQDIETGANETISLYFPEGISTGSRSRIFGLILGDNQTPGKDIEC